MREGREKDRGERGGERGRERERERERERRGKEREASAWCTYVLMCTNLCNR